MSVKQQIIVGITAAAVGGVLSALLQDWLKKQLLEYQNKKSLSTEKENIFVHQ